MKWFSRRREERSTEHSERRDPVAAAEGFWRRWHEMLPEINAALGDREPQRFENLLSDAVAAMHPDLHFAVELGQRSSYALVLSGQEDPELRPFTDAWAATAPQVDAIWEYHDSVPPVPDPTAVTVNLGPVKVNLSDIRVVAQVDEDDGVVDVAVHHPEMANLAEAARSAMTFLPLDATLGERLAGQRLRRVETAVNEPESTIDLLQLRELVRDLAARRVGADAAPADDTPAPADDTPAPADDTPAPADDTLGLS